MQKKYEKTKMFALLDPRPQKSFFLTGLEITWGSALKTWDYPQPTLDAARTENTHQIKVDKQIVFSKLMLFESPSHTRVYIQ